jgi:transposase, IS6 family
MTTARPFRGFRFPAEVILWAVRWYLQFPVSYRVSLPRPRGHPVKVRHAALAICS